LIGIPSILEAISALESIRRKIKRISVEWWWLESGEASIVRVRVIQYRDGGLRIIGSPLVSLAVAVRYIIENLELMKRFSRYITPSIVEVVEEDIERVRLTLENILDAHECIKSLDTFLSELGDFVELGIVDREDKPKIEEIIKDTIISIGYDIREDPLAWRQAKDKYSSIFRLVDAIMLRYAQRALVEVAQQQGVSGTSLRTLAMLEEKGLVLPIGRDFETKGWTEE